MRAAFLIGRVLFGGFFLLSGLNHFTHYAAITGAARSGGLPFPELATIASGVLLVVGGATVILGLWPRLGLALLVLFLVPAAFLMHDYWTVSDPSMRMVQQANFLRNLALAGGSLALMALPLPWASSVDEKRGHPLPRHRTAAVG